ncbi:MAG: hypothetical protein HKO96_03130 [Flavobacteriaceae bacterium]|nr:hypothetical protein [Flavobacteriaceae bacterium]
MRIFLLCMLLIFVASCEEPFDPYLVSPTNIGYLTDSTKVSDLKLAFPTDSLATYIGGDEFTGQINDIDVYNSEGIKILSLTPFEALDSTSTIKTVRVLDDQFRTELGVSRSSRYSDIRSNYKISSVQNTIRHLIVSVDDINAYFTIEKTELPANMRYDMNLKIDPIQIPENARIKDFFIQWY